MLCDSMKAIDLAFSCYPVTSIKRSRAFYEGVLGLKATEVWVKNDRYGMIEYDIGPCTLAIGAGAENFAVGKGGATVAIEVRDFKKAIAHLKAKKCTFLVKPTETPICSMAAIVDPDGNKILIHKRKPRKHTA